MTDLIEIFETLQTAWGFRALIISSMVGIMCGVLGCFIVLRNMSLIGDALSHAILPGVVFAFMIVGYNILGFFIGAVLAGLFSAFMMTWLPRNVKTKNDAAMGIVFTAMFSVGVIFITKVSRKGAHLDLKDFLFGNVLGVGDNDLYLTGFVTLYVVISVFVFYRQLFATTFQPVIAQTMGISVSTVHYFLMMLLSFAVVASLQAVGVILVVAMLITPAATALLLSDKMARVLVISGFIGFLSTVLGLIVSIWLETTSGPAMVVTATVIYLLVAMFAPDKGLLFRTLAKRKIKTKIRLEDTLKQSLKLSNRGGIVVNELVAKLGFNKRLVEVNLNKLIKLGFLNKTGTDWQLTTKGEEEANKLVRAHRLWETYLVQQMGLNAEQIHAQAEDFEHHLSEEILDEMQASLGYPEVDPHGSPIPHKKIRPNFSILNMALNEQATISKEQLDSSVEADLWEYGLLHGTTLAFKEEDEKIVIIEAKGKKIKIPKKIAGKIKVEKV